MADKFLAVPCATKSASFSGPSNVTSDPSASGDRKFSSSSHESTATTSSLGYSGDEDHRNNTNIYVSELPPTISAAKFQWLFAPFGVIISARLVPRRKGFLPVGFVQYTTTEAAQAAIAMMDHTKVMGATISVRLARRDKDKGIDNRPCATLYVANLPLTSSESDLRMVFSPYGAIKSALIFRHQGLGTSKGTGLVRFMDINGAIIAKEALQCAMIPGHDRPLEVKFAESKHDKELRHEGRKDKLAAKSSEPAEASVVPTLEVPLLMEDSDSSSHHSGSETACQATSSSEDLKSENSLAMRVFRNCMQFLQSYTPQHQDTECQTPPTHSELDGDCPAERTSPTHYVLFPQGGEVQSLPLLGGI